RPSSNLIGPATKVSAPIGSKSAAKMIVAGNIKSLMSTGQNIVTQRDKISK
ncbi:hypothetical protein NDU88_001795, partial [Pleurodeles waltl]